MARWITWTTQEDRRGWACSACSWEYPLPSLLDDPEAKSAYDRLAHAKFAQHDCAKYVPKQDPSQDEAFSDRVRKLIARGYKPKDAVELVLQEVELEYRQQPKKIERARAEAEEFLRNLRQGRI